LDFVVMAIANVSELTGLRCKRNLLSQEVDCNISYQTIECL